MHTQLAKQESRKWVRTSILQANGSQTSIPGGSCPCLGEFDPSKQDSDRVEPIHRQDISTNKGPYDLCGYGCFPASDSRTSIESLDKS